jgi:zinc transport system ATP-binding protein
MNDITSDNSRGEPCITVSHLSYGYTDDLVLEDLSFSIEQGDYVGMLGPNGSGKTTLLKIILGLIEPTKGTVKIFGEDVHYFKDGSWIGYVPQSIEYSGWEFPATVEEVVRSGRTAKVGLLRRFRKQDRAAVQRAMEMTGIYDLRKKLINEVSGGQRQRIFIARALAAEPKVLILDEPTVGVDPAAQEQFYSLLRMINEQQGITILFVSHDIDVITHEAKTILCLNKTLVCHVDSGQFINKEHLEKLYGQKGKYILHGHNI